MDKFDLIANLTLTLCKEATGVTSCLYFLGENTILRTLQKIQEPISVRQVNGRNIFGSL